MVYGGKEAFTGPTISKCSVEGDSLLIEFNTSLLRGGKLAVNPYNRQLNDSHLEVMTNGSNFCMEPQPVNRSNRDPRLSQEMCPTLSAGVAKQNF